ncbi:MAG TPA: hypothetical protein VMQ78_01065 [Candidatus Limnocylindria bacterium]|nr:hypothetical protein [Candidatus Limnocylindria bacterium]
MIQDLDGAVSEPTRHPHVVALSAATAVVSLVLLFALIAPPAHFGATPQAASLAPSPRGYEMTVVGTPLHHLRLDLTRDSVCPDGTRSIPPYALVSDASSGELLFAMGYVVGGMSRAVQAQLVLDEQTSYWVVACGTFETRAVDRPLDIAR